MPWSETGTMQFAFERFWFAFPRRRKALRGQRRGRYEGRCPGYSQPVAQRGNLHPPVIRSAVGAFRIQTAPGLPAKGAFSNQIPKPLRHLQAQGIPYGDRHVEPDIV